MTQFDVGILSTERRNPVQIQYTGAERRSRKEELGLIYFRIDPLRESPDPAVKLVEKCVQVVGGTDVEDQNGKHNATPTRPGVTRLPTSLP